MIAVHLQGLGHTKDIDRRPGYESMAGDVAALAAYLKVGRVDALGYSPGGGMAILMAIRHPEAVRRIIVISTAMRSEGWFPEVRAAFQSMPAHAGQIAGGIRGYSPLGRLYPEVDWKRLVAKIGELQSSIFDWTADVERIASPAQLIFADADSIYPEHIAAFYRALGGGRRDADLDGSLRSPARLGSVPGATHYTIVSTPMVTEMVLPFLASAM